jgi:hypothetical protein
MYGWCSEFSNESRQETTVLYNFSKNTIASTTPFHLSICNIISDYASKYKHATFQLWEQANRASCNWFGDYTFGTAWFRGCKVWLQPHTGFVFPGMFQLFKNENSGVIKEEIIKLFKKHLDKNESTSNDSTSLQPFRLRKPIELITEIKRATCIDQETILFHGEGIYNEKQAIKIKSWFTKSKIFVIDDEIRCETDDDPTEGGVNVFVIHDQENLEGELQWIQELGEHNHGIEFEWI